MPYIGNQSTNSYSSMVKQDLTGASGASVTLSHPVANANEVELYINNVRQEPTTSYTTSGTTLSFVNYTVAASDDIYVIFSGKALQTVVPPDGSVSTAKIADSAVSTAKIASSAVDLTSKVTGVLPVANSQTNTPAFQARRATNLTLTENTDVKVTGFTEDFDTDNNFASDRFTPTTAGKYLVTITGNIQSVSSYDIYNGKISIYKNGSEFIQNGSQGHGTSRSNRYGLSPSLIIDMNGSSDYLEMYCYLNTVSGGDVVIEAGSLSFGAFKLIGA